MFNVRLFDLLLPMEILYHYKHFGSSWSLFFYQTVLMLLGMFALSCSEKSENPQKFILKSRILYLHTKEPHVAELIIPFTAKSSPLNNDYTIHGWRWNDDTPRNNREEWANIIGERNFTSSRYGGLYTHRRRDPKDRDCSLSVIFMWYDC